MANIQNYGITYPFSNNQDDGVYLDVNKTFSDGVKSKLLHVLFTPKGQKLRDPAFGTDLIKFLFSPADGETLNDLKISIREDISRYVSGVQFDDISIYEDDNDAHSRIIVVHYSVKKGNNKESNSVAIKI